MAEQTTEELMARHTEEEWMKLTQTPGLAADEELLGVLTYADSQRRFAPSRWPEFIRGIELHIQYRQEINNAEAFYKANAEARIVASVTEDATWCQKIIAEAKEKATKARVDKAREVVEWQQANPDWRELFSYTSEVPGIGAFNTQPNERSSKASENAKFAIKEPNLKDYVDEKYRILLEICMKCIKDEKNFREEYKSATENRSIILNKIAEKRKKIAENNRIGSNYSLNVATAIEYDVQKLEQSLTKEGVKNIAEKYVKNENDCKAINENSKPPRGLVIKDKFEPALEVLSFLPVVGTPASLTLAAIYALNGEYDEATINFIATLLPGAKIVSKGGKMLVKLTAAEAKKITEAAFRREAQNMAHLTEKQIEATINGFSKLTQVEKNALKEAIIKEKAIIEKIKRVGTKERAAAVKKEPPSSRSPAKLSCIRCASK